MLKSYLFIALRQLKHRLSSTIIHVTGLTLGISSCLILLLVIKHEYSFDKFHQHADQIYRVETTKISPGDTSSYPGAPLGLAGALRNDFPEVRQVTTISYEPEKMISITDAAGIEKRFKEPVAFVHSDVFSVFDYEWVAGNPQVALKEPNTALMTESEARKLFQIPLETPAAAAVGKSFRMGNNLSVKVSGILADPPLNTDFGFEIMVSFATLKSMDPSLDLNSWNGWSDNNQTYVVLAPGKSPKQLETRFPQLVEKYQGQGRSAKRGQRLVPLHNIHFESSFKGHTADPKMLRTLIMIGFFLLLVACINFINLATAQAARRAREVGVRKALGSTRSLLIGQFLGETILLTLIGVVLAYVFCWAVIPFTEQLTGVKLTRMMLLDPVVVASVLALLVVVGLLAGFYPAWVLSGYKPVLALKNRMVSQGTGGLTLRRGLVTLQFVIAQVVLMAAIVIGSQMRMFKEADLGFDKNAIITVPLPDADLSRIEPMRNQLLQLPRIKHVSFSYNSPSAEGNFMGDLLYRNTGRTDTINTQFKLVDLAFLDLYGIKLLAGEGFRPSDMNTSDSLANVLVNEVFVSKLGVSRQQDAIGKVIYNGNQVLTIIGVVQDFHVNSLHQKIDPTLIGVGPQFFQQAGIKLQTEGSTREQLAQVITDIEKVWKQTYPEAIFNYQFLDQTLDQAYKKEDRTLKQVNLLSAIAILISCLGLYGLISFMTVQRSKEVGIRKVLGASVGHIVLLFIREFVVLVVIAFLIAAPIGFLLMRNWLDLFAFRVPIGVGLFLITIASTLTVALLTMSFQSIKAALSNPVRSLKSD